MPMPTSASRATCSSRTEACPDANAARGASSSRARLRSASTRRRLGWLWLDMIRRVLRLPVTMIMPEAPPVSDDYATTGGSPMTAADQRTNSPTPAPGGTAQLAGRTVARIGFGAMQLDRKSVGRDTALAILRLAIRKGVNHLDNPHFYGP